MQDYLVADLLVPLYSLPQRPIGTAPGLSFSKPIGAEIHLLEKWLRQAFGEIWLSELRVSLYNNPRTCWLARLGEELVGFACYDATALGFFGPFGILENYRRRGIGKALLIETLHDMRSHGYGYAIIGHANDTGYYERAVGARLIKGSSPGIYGSTARYNDA